MYMVIITTISIIIIIIIIIILIKLFIQMAHITRGAGLLIRARGWNFPWLLCVCTPPTLIVKQNIDNTRKQYPLATFFTFLPIINKEN